MGFTSITVAVGFAAIIAMVKEAFIVNSHYKNCLGEKAQSRLGPVGILGFLYLKILTKLFRPFLVVVELDNLVVQFFFEMH